MKTAVLLLVISALLVGATADEKIEDDPYIVEMLVVLDKPMYDKWANSIGNGTEEQVRAEVTAMFFEVNILYQSLRAYNVSIEIRLKEIVIPHVHILPEENILPDGTVWERQVDSYFAQWLKNSTYRGWDHAMILTSHRMKGNGPVLGVAAVNAICSWRGRSRVKGQMNYSTVVTIAHELAHSLGASHDPRKRPECKLPRYIMYSSVTRGSRNRWFFSPCTAKYFKWRMSRHKENSCLKRTTSLPIVSRRLGEIVPPKTFCARGSRGGLARHLTTGENVCNIFYCRKWATDASEGSPCGRGRKCYMGHCV